MQRSHWNELCGLNINFKYSLHLLFALPFSSVFISCASPVCFIYCVCSLRWALSCINSASKYLIDFTAMLYKHSVMTVAVIKLAWLLEITACRNIVAL